MAGSDFSEQAAYAKVQRLACVREQASVALRQRLVREGFAEDVADAAIGRAVACGIVDDVRYAEAFVRSRLAAGHGSRGIEAELASLGIDIACVSDEEGASHGGGALPDDDGEVERALEVLRRRPPHAKNQREAAYRRLMQKGYGSSVSSSAARLWSESS